MQPLDGFAVLVTRPPDQNEPLAEAIEAAGGTAIRAPMIVVAGLDDDRAAAAAAQVAAAADVTVFVSRNAARFGVELLERTGVSLEGKAVYAVGLGTRAALEKLQVSPVMTPAKEFSTEGLLKLEGLQEPGIKGRHIVIFRGVGGREDLAKTLRLRGAEVGYCECYERRKPVVDLSAELAHAKVKVPDIGLATSLEGLSNLVEKIEEQGIDRLFDMQMLVVGTRVAQEVESIGFTLPPLVVENPSDQSILRRLIKWAEEEA